jgi:hypothetical protein
MKDQRRSIEVQLYSFLNLSTRWGWVLNTKPRSPYSQEINRYPLYRKLGGPQGRSKQMQKISPHPGFDPPIYQAVERFANNELEIVWEKPSWPSSGKKYRVCLERLKKKPTEVSWHTCSLRQNKNQLPQKHESKTLSLESSCAKFCHH